MATTTTTARSGHTQTLQWIWAKPHFAVVLACLAIWVAFAYQSVPGETAAQRYYFYLGGHYADDGKGGHIFEESLYVEQLIPAGGVSKKYPLVFIHGQGLTGTSWLNKPDGGSGWASFFLRQGFEVYLMDQTFRGRSSASPNASFTVYSAEYVQQHHTAPGLYNLWPQASLHTQWNGTGTMGDPIFDTHYASGVQFLTPGAVKQQLTVQKAGAALLDHIGTPVILVGHSQGGTMPWLIADARPNLTRAIIAVEPSGPPFQEAVFKNTPAREFGLTDAPLTYNPRVVDPSTDLLRETLLSTNSLVSDCTLQASERPRQLVNLKDVDVLVVTSPSGYHAQYDWCTVLYLQQAGVNANNLLLPEHGLEGNGHLMFLEKNSDDIAQLLLARMQSLK